MSALISCWTRASKIDQIRTSLSIMGLVPPPELIIRTVPPAFGAPEGAAWVGAAVAAAAAVGAIFVAGAEVGGAAVGAAFGAHAAVIPAALANAISLSRVRRLT